MFAIHEENDGPREGGSRGFEYSCRNLVLALALALVLVLLLVLVLALDLTLVLVPFVPTTAVEW